MAKSSSRYRVSDVRPLLEFDEQEPNNDYYVAPDQVVITSLPVDTYSRPIQMRTLQKVLQEANYTGDFKLLVVGRTGRGKSTLLNRIIEEKVMTEGAHGAAATKNVKTYPYKASDDLTITLLDSPGLQDKESNSQSDYNLVQQLKSKGDGINIILYCVKMTDIRIDNDEIMALKKLFQNFGPKFWERVTIVLTFSNKEDCKEWDTRDEDDQSQEPDSDDEDEWNELKKKRFINRIRIKRDELKQIFVSKIHIPSEIVNKMHVVPAGSYKKSKKCRHPLSLPDREDWLYDLLKLCCNDTESLKLSALNLRDSIHLAIIIDNDGEVDQSTANVSLNAQAEQFQAILEENNFLVLSFNNLSSESVAKLFQIIKEYGNPNDLAALVVIILCKGKKNCAEFNLGCVFSGYPQSFTEVTKIFFVHFTSPEHAPFCPTTVPENSISLIVSSSKIELNYRPVALAFSENLNISFRKPLKKCFQNFHDVILEQGRECTYQPSIGQSTTLPAVFEPFGNKNELDFIKRKVIIQRTLWLDIRSDTIDILLQNKDEIRRVLRNERIARITTAVTGIVGGGGLVIAGLAAAPFTLGASLGLAIAGGAVGAAASLGGMGALITRRIMANARLKNAQQHISFDQQFSKNLNKAVFEYKQQIEKYSTTEFAGSMSNTFASIGGRLGMASAVVVEGVVETGALALRAGARTAGIALAGISLAVTVPVDLAFIVYHSHGIYQAKGDESGAKEKDAFVKWFIQHIDALLKNAFSIDSQTYTAQADHARYDNECGLKLEIPAVKDKDKYTVTVSTLFSGPFILQGATLVSAVYDVSINGKLKEPVTVEIEHCVDMDKLSNPKTLSFAFGSVDFARKKFTFNAFADGEIKENTGKIFISESCLLCMLYTGSSQQYNPVKYTAFCSYTSEYHNSLNMRVLFTKSLTSHIKYVAQDYNGELFEKLPFQMKEIAQGQDHGIMLDDFKSCMRKDGWMISPNDVPDKISRKQIDTAEIQPDFRSRSDKAIKLPSLTLNVQVFDENIATDELKYVIHVKGTDLIVPINVTKV